MSSLLVLNRSVPNCYQSAFRNTVFMTVYLARFCNLSTNPVTANSVRIFVVCVSVADPDPDPDP